jgi:hypothetical protein
MKRIHGIPEEGESGKRYTGRGEGIDGNLIKMLKRGIAKSIDTEGVRGRKENVLFQSKSTGYTINADITADREVHLKTFMPPDFKHDDYRNRKPIIEQAMNETFLLILVD